MLSAHPSTTSAETGGLNRPRRLAVEALGCGLLVVALEGAHHGAEHLGVSATDGRLFMSLAAGAVLACLTLVLQPLSGAHFNPALTFADALEDGTPWRDVPRYVLAQLAGGLAGRWVAHLMCGEPLLIATHTPSASSAQFLSELVATFGLLIVVRGCVRVRPSATPLVVAGYVAATVWFTESRSLANPALILARAASTRTSALHPLDVESFIAAQMLGAALAVCLFRWLMAPATKQAAPLPWSVIFQCSRPSVAEKAAAVFNGLAAPESARGTVDGPLCAVDTRGPPPLVVRLVLEGEVAPLGDGAVWHLAASEEDTGTRLQESLREHTQRLLRTRGWSRLRVVGDSTHEVPGPTA
ncbi:aquaporin [Myxococcus stipitatus]|uniref:aquaporin n=1 Tax=Myxococcus stipitatus TaxID=83455 RepID=UPI0030CE5AD7